jgi:hypothetical protein
MYQTVHMFYMGSVLQITYIWFNVLRSARTLNHPTDRIQVSKLDQLVTIKHMAINSHGHKIHNTTRIYDELWANNDMHSSEEGCFRTWIQAGHQNNSWR